MKAAKTGGVTTIENIFCLSKFFFYSNFMHFRIVSEGKLEKYVAVLVNISQCKLVRMNLICCGK